MIPTEIDTALRQRLTAQAPLDQPVDVDEVLAAVNQRVHRRRRRHRGTAAVGAMVVLVAVTAAAVSQALDDRPAVQTGPNTDGTHRSEVDADLLWIGWQEGPTLADPNTGRTTPIGPRQHDQPWCNTCPLVRLGDRAFTSQGGRIYAYTPGADELIDLGIGNAVFPAADGQTILVLGDDEIEQWSPDGAVLAGPWAIPAGYQLTIPRRATATGVLVEATANAFIRTLAEWDPTSGDIQPLGTHNQLIDTHIAPDGTMIARTDCDNDFPCWLLLTDTRTGHTTRIDSPVPGNGIYGGGAFSPDGRQLAVFVATNQGNVDPAAQLAIIDTDSGHIELIDNAQVPVGEPYGYAAWSPSGDWLFFNGISGNLRIRGRGDDRARQLDLAGSYSLVALNRSDSPNPRGTAPATTMPDIEGRTVADATDVLAEAGLVIGIDNRLDSTDAAAIVIAQEPPAGTPAAHETVVGVRTAAPLPDSTSECPNARTPLCAKTPISIVATTPGTTSRRPIPTSDATLGPVL